MAFSRPQMRRGILWATAQISALILIMLIAPVSGAQAHDVLESTTPGNGATVATMPDAIEMTFNNTPIAIGSEIIINDNTGKNWATGPVDILDNHVTQALKPGAPAGTFTVEWRVVSSDSHPIEGTFSFSVTSSSEPDSTVQSQSATTVPANQDSGLPWGIVGGGAGALILIALLITIAKRRLSQPDQN